MGLHNFLRLLLLAALWGGSFLFMRIAAPVIGPAILIEFRLLLAALFLLAASWYLNKNLNLIQHWKHFAMLGWFNTALPFLLIAFAAQTLSASLLSIINATAPIWGTLLIALRLRQKVALKTLLGLAIGITGVMLLVGFDQTMLNEGAAIAVISALCAALCYGIASCYAQGKTGVEPFANAHGSMWLATILLVPVQPFFPAQSSTEPLIIGSVLLLGVFSTGVAYLLYFRLVAEVGAASALTVTYLVPVFGVLWGWLFLDEAIGWHTIAGTAIVLTGTALVTGFKLSTLRRTREQAHV